MNYCIAFKICFFQSAQKAVAGAKVKQSLQKHRQFSSTIFSFTFFCRLCPLHNVFILFRKVQTNYCIYAHMA